jgi:hypothetical protein
MSAILSGQGSSSMLSNLAWMITDKILDSMARYRTFRGARSGCGFLHTDPP